MRLKLKRRGAEVHEQVALRWGRETARMSVMRKMKTRSKPRIQIKLGRERAEAQLRVKVRRR
jgi:hypothetical protein